MNSDKSASKASFHIGGYLSADQTNELLAAALQAHTDIYSEFIGQHRQAHLLWDNVFEAFGERVHDLTDEDVCHLAFILSDRLTDAYPLIELTGPPESVEIIMDSCTMETVRLRRAQVRATPPYPNKDVRDIESSAESAADAISALDDIVKSTVDLDDEDERYSELWTSLERYLRSYGQMGMVEISRLVLTSGLDEEFRAQILSVVAHLPHSETLRYRIWLATRALNSFSVYIRYAATSALLFLNAPPNEIESAANREVDPQLKSKMLRIAGKLDQKNRGTSAAAD